MSMTREMGERIWCMRHFDFILSEYDIKRVEIFHNFKSKTKQKCCTFDTCFNVILIKVSLQYEHISFKPLFFFTSKVMALVFFFNHSQ